MPEGFKITEVELQKGSHQSADKGLCFMEMAAWFAGEDHTDRPMCVCPVLGAYGRPLNDTMPHELRNSILRPLVPLIVGTRDSASENARAEFLAMWTVNKIIPPALRQVGLHDVAATCERATDLTAASRAAAAAALAAARAARAADDGVWTVAVDGLRKAILIGKHEPFTSNIDWHARKTALIDMVAA